MRAECHTARTGTEISRTEIIGIFCDFEMETDYEKAEPQKLNLTWFSSVLLSRNICSEVDKNSNEMHRQVSL